ncbi:MAG: transposase [Candidatus Acidiferrum sp.]|jgi:transposase
MDTSERAVVKREPQRRRWPAGEKCRIVEQTLRPGASVARVALAHGVNANQVFTWRRQYRQGLLSERNAEPVKLLPVHVSEVQASKVNRSDRRQVAVPTAGTIQVEFPKGHVCISGSVDGEALRMVLENLLR